MKKRSKKSTAGSGSKLYRKRLARIAGFGLSDADAEPDALRLVQRDRGPVPHHHPRVTGTAAFCVASPNCPDSLPE